MRFYEFHNVSMDSMGEGGGGGGGASSIRKRQSISEELSTVKVFSSLAGWLLQLHCGWLAVVKLMSVFCPVHVSFCHTLF